MSFHLTDLTDERHHLKVNAWHWRPTLELIASFELIDDERLEGMSFNGSTTVTQEEAKGVGRRLERDVLPRLELERLNTDFGTTGTDDATFYRAPETMHKNYGVTYEWLQTFADFCLTSKGFEVS